jgi:Spy/CpxP family protein refolding chaperone
MGVQESLQTLVALSGANDAEGVTAYLSQLLPGQIDQICEQLQVLGKSEQAAALQRVKVRQMVERLTPEQRHVAEATGMGVEAYAAALEKRGR